MNTIMFDEEVCPYCQCWWYGEFPKDQMFQQYMCHECGYAVGKLTYSGELTVINQSLLRKDMVTQ